MGKFRVTYEYVTPESAEEGEAAETGFVLPGGWMVTIASAMDDKHGQYDMTLREALDLAQPDCDCGRWFSETTQDRCNYATGAVETRSIHPPQDITPSSYARLRRLLRAR